MSNPIFDAFFWIEPVKSSAKTNGTKVLWNYPDDVSSIVEEFKDIPEFCFPDLQRVALEKAQTSRSEHYTFTLTDSSGKRVYGICMRSLFRGVTRRYDVKRRVRHCLCVITRYPFFKFFKSILMELHAVAMLEEKPGCCRQFIDCVYRLSDMSNSKEQSISVPTGTISAMYAEFSLTRPKASSVGISSKEVPILPLFDTLGTERFFKLLSAVLCEKRIVFIADEAETLSSTVLAAASMLHPFQWHHVFIPLLPGKLLSLLLSQMPYMIGVRKYLLSELRRDSLDGCVVVDCDTGDIRLQGQVHVRDLIGDAATARKQASESIDQMKAKMSGMASMLMGKAANEIPSDVGPKDLMMVLLSDLKSSVTSTKPSSYSISSLLGGGGGAANRSAEEAKMAWAIDAEKALRDNLTCFFLYFFADLEDYMTTTASGGSISSFGTVKSGDSAGRRMSAMGSDGSGSGADIKFGPDDSRSHFDLRAFMSKRTAMGDSKHLLGFVADFIHSQIFERYCGELLAKKLAKGGDANKRRSLATSSSSTYMNTPGSGSGASRGGVNSLPAALSGSLSSSAGGVEEEPSEDTYERAVLEWAARGQALTIANAKTAVAAANPTPMGASKDMGSNFHNLVVQFTSGATPLAPCEVEIDRDSQYYTSYLGAANGTAATDSSSYKETAKRLNAVDGVLRRIIADASHGDDFVTIMRTIYFRLQGSLATGNRGQPGVAGVRALILCRHLLVEGPECVVTYCMDFIPVLRAILRLSLSLEGGGAGAKKTSKQQQALDYMSLGAFMDPTMHAKTVLDLVIDHKKLMVQRKVSLLLKKNSFPFLTTTGTNKELKVAQFARTEMLFSASFSASKLFPRFDALHNSLNPLGIPNIAPDTLTLTAPELAVGAVEDRLKGDLEDDETPGSSFQPPPSGASAGSNSPGPRSAATDKFLATQAAAAAVTAVDAPFAPSIMSATSATVPPAAPARQFSHSSASNNGISSSAPPSAAKTKQRFIYDDEDDGADAFTPTVAATPFAPTVAAASFTPTVAAAAPVKPDKSRAVSPMGVTAPAAAAAANSRTASPFKATAPVFVAPAAAPSTAAAVDFAPTQPSVPSRRPSTIRLTPPPPGSAQKRPGQVAAAAAAAQDLLNMDMPSGPAIASATPAPAAAAAVSDPFGSDAFIPSFPAPVAAAAAPPASVVDPFTPSFAASTPSTGAAPKSQDPFAPSTTAAAAAWGGPSVAAMPATSSPFDDFAPSVPGAFAPTVPTAAATDPFQPSFTPSFTPSVPSMPVYPARNNNNAFAASDFASSSFATQAPSAAAAGGRGGYGYIHTQPPGSGGGGGGGGGGMGGGAMGGGQQKPAVDPFDFLNPIKK